jgi:[glutamine synthetase] adenylyltransferase / [glutamine synthetase]-adenylyl-L-tyrosine phosphorylase
VDPNLDELGARAAALVTGSRSLAELLRRDPEAGSLLGEEHTGVQDAAALGRTLSSALEAHGVAGVRRARRRLLLQIAAFDLAGEIPFEVVGAALSDLADASLSVSLRAVEAPPELAVIGMGKLGARELNYSSDIDVMFVTSGDLGSSTRAAEALMHEMTAFSPDGQMYRVDVDLRPEGRAGALVRTVDGFVEYYRRWAKPWEFQALIKARACAGAPEPGAALIERAEEFVYPAEISPERIAEVRRMKERVETHAAQAARRSRSLETDDVKLGPGGIRDIEFAVQLLQLVHGGADEDVRAAATLDALRALTSAGYIAEDDGAGLAVAYRWLRTVEHRVQLWQERQVHRLPSDPDERGRIARGMGFRATPGRSALEEFDAAHHAVVADVRRRFEKLFYRPMIESLAEAGPRTLSEAALKERLRLLGFRDVERAARTLGDLVSGLSRRAKLFRVLTPALLRYLSSTPAPDQGLFSFLRLGEALEDRIEIAGAFRDNPPGIEFLARVLGSGKLLGELVGQVPEELASIADPRGPTPPKERDRLVREAVGSLSWRASDDRLNGLRRFKRRELVRIALADLAGIADSAAVGRGLSHLAEACLEAALGEGARGFAVIGMGKLGAGELNYASDIDVMFVHEVGSAEAETIGEQLVRAIGDITPEGHAFRIDMALRPEGKAGPLVRSFDSYLEYYERWAKPWEHLALIKARFVAGDRELGERLVAATRDFAYPQKLDSAALVEIRHLKARIERERVPRGTDPRRHLKLGPGGASDVEFTIQILQHTYGRKSPEVQSPGTLEAIEAAAAAGLLAPDEAARLMSAYEFVSRLRNRLFLLHGRNVDALPVKPEDLEALGIAMGYKDQPRQEIEEEYLRVTRRARRIAESVIYG